MTNAMIQETINNLLAIDANIFANLDQDEQEEFARQYMIDRQIELSQEGIEIY